jgi:hypothetical protein
MAGLRNLKAKDIIYCKELLERKGKPLLQDQIRFEKDHYNPK